MFKITDVTEKFRLALLELVPSLFDPEYLAPKKINGGRVRTQDLLEYFQKYVAIFNSDEVPEAVTIFKVGCYFENVITGIRSAAYKIKKVKFGSS